jgi:hypothetical protein
MPGTPDRPSRVPPTALDEPPGCLLFTRWRVTRRFPGADEGTAARGGRAPEAAVALPAGLGATPRRTSQQSVHRQRTAGITGGFPNRIAERGHGVVATETQLHRRPNTGYRESGQSERSPHFPHQHFRHFPRAQRRSRRGWPFPSTVPPARNPRPVPSHVSGHSRPYGMRQRRYRGGPPRPTNPAPPVPAFPVPLPFPQHFPTSPAPRNSPCPAAPLPISPPLTHNGAAMTAAQRMISSTPESGLPPRSRTTCGAAVLDRTAATARQKRGEAR